MFQPPKGTRDFLPEEAIPRQLIVDRLRLVFESFGFDPAESPAFENWELLTAKGGGGDEIKKQIYYFKDKSGRELGLRFDLTVPLARIISGKPDLQKPFKRYQMGPVWRYEEIKAGRRYREFWQADADIIGVSGQEADAELLALGCSGLQSLGISKFSIRLNSRPVLEGLVMKAGIPDKLFLAACRALDKLDKFGQSAVKTELKQIGISEQSIKKLFALTEIKGDNKAIIAKLKKEGIRTDDLENLLEAVRPYGIEKSVRIWPGLARGLDYYTGPIFEFYIEGKEDIGAITAGGRYDKLIEVYGGKPTPATGISFGVDRLQTIFKNESRTKTKVFVMPIKDGQRRKAIEIAQTLRKSGLNVQTDLSVRPLSKQMEFVGKAGIPFVLFVGPKEIASGRFTLRDMKTGKESVLQTSEIIKRLKS